MLEEKSLTVIQHYILLFTKSRLFTQIHVQFVSSFIQLDIACPVSYAESLYKNQCFHCVVKKTISMLQGLNWTSDVQFHQTGHKLDTDFVGESLVLIEKHIFHPKIIGLLEKSL